MTSNGDKSLKEFIKKATQAATDGVTLFLASWVVIFYL